MAFEHFPGSSNEDLKALVPERIKGVRSRLVINMDEESARNWGRVLIYGLPAGWQP